LAGPLAIVARVYGKSTTFAYHDYLPTQSWKRQLVAVVGMFMASRVLVPSRGSFAALPRQIKGKTQVVNNDRGVIEAPLSAHCQALLAKWNLAANKAARGDGLRVIVVGRVEHNKGLGELLQDLPQGMVKEVLCLGAIGDEKLWRDLQEIGTKRNIALRNTCCELAQVAVHYRDADLCIHYSRYESTTPFAFSDAWRFGVPAFVRDVPVATEFASSTFVIKDAGSLRGRFALTPLVILDAIQEQIHLLFAPSFLGRTECSPMSGETDGLNK
jgi:glycosyltransferase involved in cell wall biosynthesis